jgi:aryl-alcohol dehydrogenase-like predicted oxidoreductase
MMRRRLGRSGIEVSAMGLGCWAIGGPWTFMGDQNGWGQVDDAESIRAIHCALDLGIDFFDTAANYGAGHSERILAQALAGRRDKTVIATKFGFTVDETTRSVAESDDIASHLRQDCEDSLRRLNTDYIDLYQFHVGDYDPNRAGAVRDTLEALVGAGKIRWYGWSTDNPEAARVFAQGPHCTAMQHRLNAAVDAQQMLAVCDAFDQASVNRNPLGMGLLTGKFTAESTFPQDDGRHDWNLREGRLAERLELLNVSRDVLTAGGRTMAQTALAWIWARSPRTIPIPGFKTVAQVQENVKAMEFGPLSEEERQEVDQLFGRS